MPSITSRFAAQATSSLARILLPTLTLGVMAFGAGAPQRAEAQGADVTIAQMGYDPKKITSTQREVLELTHVDEQMEHLSQDWTARFNAICKLAGKSPSKVTGIEREKMETATAFAFALDAEAVHYYNDANIVSDAMSKLQKRDPLSFRFSKTTMYAGFVLAFQEQNPTFYLAARDMSLNAGSLDRYLTYYSGNEFNRYPLILGDTPLATESSRNKEALETVNRTLSNDYFAERQRVREKSAFGIVSNPEESLNRLSEDNSLPKPAKEIVKNAKKAYIWLSDSSGDGQLVASASPSNDGSSHSASGHTVSSGAGVVSATP